MNKLLRNLAATFLGFAMAAGVGVAVSAGRKDASPAQATDSTISMSERASTLGWSNSIAYTSWSSSDGIFTVTASGGGNNGKWYTSGGGSWRMYSGGTVTISCDNTYTITAVSSSPTCSWTVNAQSASFSPSARTDFTSITITYSGGSGGTTTDSVTLSVDPTSLDLETGDTDTFDVSISSTGEYGTEFIVESGDESIATVSPDVGDGNGTITVTAEGVGETTITVSSVDGGQTATVDVSVSAPFVSKNYVLCTSTDDLVAGNNYIITSGTSGTVKTMSTEENGNNRKTTSATVSNSKIASTSSMLVVQLGGSEGNWTFETQNYAGTDGYLASAASGNNNYLRVISTSTTATIGFSSDAANIVIGPHTSRNKIMYNSSSDLFACYSSGQSSVYLWKETDGTSLTLDNTKYLDYVGHGFSLEATADGYEPTSWTWSSSPTGIVNIINSSGAATVTPVAAGTTTVSVTAANSGTTKTATCAVTITSKNGADTSNVLTVDDAILIAKYTGTTKTSSYYMEGIVSSMASDKYPMLSGTSDSLEVYKDCSSTVYSGDTIRVYGPIFNYNNSQPEFDGTSTVSVINIPVSSVTVTNPTPIPTGVEGGSLVDYLTVTVNGTNSRNALDQGWKVLSSSNTSIIDISGADGKTFDSGATAGSTTLTIASTSDLTKTATISVTTLDASTPVLQSVTVSGTPSKSTQYVGQTFDWTGLTFTPVYSPVKSPVESITGANITWNALVAGQNPTGTYTGDDEVSVTVTVTSVSVEADGIYSVHVSGDMSVKSYDEQATSWNYSGLVVKVTYLSDHSTQVDPESEITWSASSTPAQLGKGTGKSVNVTASVGGVSSSAYEITGITITEHQADRYGEYTGAITAGQYVIYASDGALTASVSSNRFTNTAVTISSGVITDPSASIVWTIEQIPNTNYWSIYNSGTSKYAGGTSSKNQGALLSSVEDLAKWTITYDNGYVFQNYGRTQASSDSANAYLRQNGGSGWGTYTATYGSAPTLYKLNYFPKAWASFNYVDDIPDRTEYMVGETFDPTGLEIHAVYTEPTIYAEEDITDEIVWDSLQEGNQVTGTWDGHTVTITGLTISSFTPAAYTKVTSIDQIAVGSEVIFGGYKKATETYYAMANLKSGDNYFLAEETTATSTTMNTTQNTSVWTVEAGMSGYYFKNGNNYLNLSGSSNAVGSKSENSCWTLEFSDDVLTMKNGSNSFQFNEGSPRFKCYTSTQGPISIYIKQAANETDILKTYVSRYLNPGDGSLNLIPSSPTGQAGDSCLGATGLYMTAKAALTSGEFSSYNSAFQSASDSIVANGRLRFESWAKAFGDTTPYGANVSPAKYALAFINAESTNSVAIIIIISMVSMTAIGGYFFLRKRKENI